MGAALPFSVVKLGIDTHDSPANESANNGGYTPQGNVTGISLLHESGTTKHRTIYAKERPMLTENRNWRGSKVRLPCSDATYQSVRSCEHTRQSNILATKGEYSLRCGCPLLKLHQIGNDTATVGYYKAGLANNVSFELASTRHTGFMQYNFPAVEQHVLVDLSHVSYSTICLGGLSLSY